MFSVGFSLFHFSCCTLKFYTLYKAVVALFWQKNIVQTQVFPNVNAGLCWHLQEYTQFGCRELCTFRGYVDAPESECNRACRCRWEGCDVTHNMSLFVQPAVGKVSLSKSSSTNADSGPFAEFRDRTAWMLNWGGPAPTPGYVAKKSFLLSLCSVNTSYFRALLAHDRHQGAHIHCLATYRASTWNLNKKKCWCLRKYTLGRETNSGIFAASATT